jgi:hypothetical protein
VPQHGVLNTFFPVILVIFLQKSLSEVGWFEVLA